MDKFYADTVRLLLSVAPDVFASDIFALKGGTALNLFVHDMPRLSVDLDLVYVPRDIPRPEALRAITMELAAVRERLVRMGLDVRAQPAAQQEESRLLVAGGGGQVKVEVNHVFRGTVLPVEQRALTKGTAERFSVELTLPVLAVEELVGSKLVAAMDRQHPRDLFDVREIYRAGGLSEGAVECFVTYLAGHNRPIQEVLFATPKDIATLHRAELVGMTAEPVDLDELLSVRELLFKELPRRLKDAQREFLLGLSRAEPDWSLLKCAHASELPALRWKLENLRKLKKSNMVKFEQQAEALRKQLLR